MQLHQFSRRDMLKLSSTAAVIGFFAPLFHISPVQATENLNKKALVVYFSMPETDTPHNMTREEENSTVVIDGKVLGNTQYVAQLIQEMTGGDIFRIVPQTPYPTDHRTLVDLAKEEQNENARPVIAGTVNLAAYDTIFLGYPNWWGDMPMILYTFLEQYDFSGKTIIPFCTHGGSGFSRTIQTMQGKQPNATVIRDGYALSRSRMERAPSGVAEWLKEVGLKK
ncbi:flavodoxin [uncultured Bilophila sp.]|uniref:flavodoxin n=1 Tax=uncultured Bilophila sp. TaxID=529385 RepID=UPI00280BFC2C|nr:flavodoxin [uncultured Bilophila sp.]